MDSHDSLIESFCLIAWHFSLPAVNKKKLNRIANLGIKIAVQQQHIMHLTLQVSSVGKETSSVMYHSLFIV